MLGLEASSVIAQRAMKLAAGAPDAEVEARRMVSEKFAAGAALQTLAMTGALGATPAAVAARTLAYYRRKVRANNRRLARR
jgi:hypothetical protein